MTPAMKSFIDYPSDHPFPIQNLPYGVFKTKNDPTARCGVAIGDYILDLKALSSTSFFPDVVPKEVFQGCTLNAFMSLDRKQWTTFRQQLQKLLIQGSPLEKAPEARDGKLIIKRNEDVTMCLPAQIGDYTDFYASLEHAYNCGVLFRSKENALQPNWRHLPVGYHGRVSSIVVSGTEIHRPVGQILPQPGATQPIIAPCKRLDYELEVGFFYGGAATHFGQRLSPAQAADHIFGAVILNDWSARDIQAWEYVPLGPFLSKNFATTISPWIVPIDALEEFKRPGYDRDPPVLPYLEDPDNTNFAIPLEVRIRCNAADGYNLISRSSLQHTYYTMRQMMAHHSTTGCPLNPGDLFGTGTLSAPGEDGYGSLIEKSKMGREEFIISSKAKKRTFLEDGDSVLMTGLARSENGYCIGFGGCEGTILPAIPIQSQ